MTKDYRKQKQAFDEIKCFLKGILEKKRTEKRTQQNVEDEFNRKPKIFIDQLLKMTYTDEEILEHVFTVVAAVK